MNVQRAIVVSPASASACIKTLTFPITLELLSIEHSYFTSAYLVTSPFTSSQTIIIDDFEQEESIGLFVGAALKPPWTVSVVSLGLLSMMLWGGAFNTPPEWLRWGKFASFFFYGLNALIVLEFKDAPPIKCKAGSTLPVCNMINPQTNSTFTEFDSELILLVQNINWEVWQYVSVLLGIIVVMRLLWYIVMRRQMHP